MIDTESFEKLLIQKVGPVGKVFLKKAMDSLGVAEVTDENVSTIIEILKLNPAMRKYIMEIEKEL